MMSFGRANGGGISLLLVALHEKQPLSSLHHVFLITRS